MIPDFSGLIGTPFKYGGRGEGFFDCYGLMIELCRRMGITLPDKDSPTKLLLIHLMIRSELKSNENWTPCEPEAGAIALFKVEGYAAHVGMMMDEEKFIHTWEESAGVCIERLSYGWDKKLVECYRYALSDK